MQDALTPYYWYKPDLAAFLQSAFSEEPSILGGVEVLTATKRESARVITERLRAREDELRDFILRLLVTLAEFEDAFAYLRRLDDGEAKVAAAVAALARVRAVTDRLRSELADSEARFEALSASAAEDSRHRALASDLERLRQQFLQLSTATDPQARGLALKPLLNQRFEIFVLDPRAAFKIEHEQIDGAFTFDTDDYLLEARRPRWSADARRGWSLESGATSTFGPDPVGSGDAFLAGLLTARQAQQPWKQALRLATAAAAANAEQPGAGVIDVDRVWELASSVEVEDLSP